MSYYGNMIIFFFIKISSGKNLQFHALMCFMKRWFKMLQTKTVWLDPWWVHARPCQQLVRRDLLVHYDNKKSGRWKVNTCFPIILACPTTVWQPGVEDCGLCTQDMAAHVLCTEFIILCRTGLQKLEMDRQITWIIQRITGKHQSLRNVPKGGV